MATIQFEITEEDRERFAKQAEREGMALDAWLISVARRHSSQPTTPAGDQFRSVEELRAFFREIAANSGPRPEPDWEEHLRNIDDSRRQGLPDV